MDEMDHLLAGLPAEKPGEALAERVIGYVLARHRRRLRFSRGLAAMLALNGIWLILPALGSPSRAVVVPDSGWPLLLATLEYAWGGVEALWQDAWGALNALQSGLASLLTISAWIGLIALALSAFLALESLLPRYSESGAVANGGLT